MKITALTTHDIRFPTSRTLDGSDAMHRSPDYSAAYVVLHTDDPELSGHGLTFTNGRGNEVCVAAIHALEPLVVGRTLEGITGDFAGFWRSLVSEDQLRWLGPEKGVMHLATAAVVNAVWDLWAKTRGVPVWRLLADLSPEEIVSTVDFRYITDALAPDEAVDLLRAAAPGRDERERDAARARLSGVHDLGRLARLRRREGRAARAARARRRLPPRQDEGRAATPRRTSAAPA